MRRGGAAIRWKIRRLRGAGKAESWVRWKDADEEEDDEEELSVADHLPSHDDT